MRIVNTFISDGGEVPSYTYLSLKKARETNPEVPIDFICYDEQSFFKELEINWIPQTSITSNELTKFNEICWFKEHGTPNTTFPSPDLFWHRTCERIYYLAAYINQRRYYDVFHFENDVLIYGDISTVPTTHAISLTPMSAQQVTFAFAHIPIPSMLKQLCYHFNILLGYGNDYLIQKYGFDHVSEMSLLHAAHEDGWFSGFPTLPLHGGESCWLFDPGSYGQYLGGTNNGHGATFADLQHFVGRALYSEDIECSFDKVPYVTQGGFRVPLFNLHVHSKSLERFM